MNATENGFCYCVSFDYVVLIYYPSYYSDIKDEGQVVADALPTGEGSMPLLRSGSAGMFNYFKART